MNAKPLFILIVGGGKVGSYLTRALMKQGHEVVVIEKNERKAKVLEMLLDTNVAVIGDGCDPVVLEQAGIARADVVVADTGDDEDNLVVVLIAKKKAPHTRCIARVNNPRNKMIFESIDLEEPVTVISSTEILLDVLNEQVNASEYKTILETMHLFGKGNLQLVKVAVPANSPADGKIVNEIDFPRNSVVVAVDRSNQDLVIPTGDTRLRAGDSVITIVKAGAEKAVQFALTGADH
ncbi:MAG: TrkA family potassium uptake protein [Candidatus Eremiobacteraeota bacterium]|nr:TrkA family potassium uptake protein [Candidatus Eremiobacteraeota bacterium]